MKRSFENAVTMPSGVVYKWDASRTKRGLFGSKHDKTIWLKRFNSKYSVESLLMSLTETNVFISLYIIGIDATGILHPTGEQLAKLLSNELSLEETFEYCRKTFCPDLSAVNTKPKNKPAIMAQPDLFEIA